MSEDVGVCCIECNINCICNSINVHLPVVVVLITLILCCIGLEIEFCIDLLFYLEYEKNCLG